MEYWGMLCFALVNFLGQESSLTEEGGSDRSKSMDAWKNCGQLKA